MLLSRGMLVNSEWLAVFLVLFSTDVQIFNRESLDFYFSLLRGESPLLRLYDGTRLSPFPQTLNDLCKKVTLYITNPDLADTRPPSYAAGRPEKEQLISNFFSVLKESGEALPNLRSMRLELLNAPCDDIFTHDRFVDFPPQITHLEMNYIYTGIIPSWILPVPTYFIYRSPKVPDWSLPGLQHLRITGAFDDLMKLVFSCPKIETLEMESCIYWDRRLKQDVRDENLIRTLFLRGIPEMYEHRTPVQVEGKPTQKLYLFTEAPVKGADGNQTYLWWLSHEFSPRDPVDYDNVQYVSCSTNSLPPLPRLVVPEKECSN